jgi:CTP synthase (UTP-ammonia lyase)
VLVEHARSQCGVADATHAEYGRGGTPIVTLLACSLNGTSIDIELTPASRLAACYGTVRATEQTTCNYGLDPAFAHIASMAGMRAIAHDATGEVRAVERPDHPFFIGTLYQPQLTTAPGQPHPIWRAFIEAIDAT